MEEILFTAAQCHVFRLPPTDMLVSDRWEGNHIWTGEVRVVRLRTEGTCSIRLVDATGAVFGNCPLYDADDGPKSFQTATDSRRCFVVRVEQGSQFAYLGLNFEDRSEAFNFSATVTDRHKHQQAAAPLPETDHTLHAGARLRVELDGKIRTAPQRGPLSVGQGEQTDPGVAPPPAFNFSAGLAAPAGASRRLTAQRGAEASPVPQPEPAPTAPSDAAAPAPAPATSGLDLLDFGTAPAPAPKTTGIDALFA